MGKYSDSTAGENNPACKLTEEDIEEKFMLREEIRLTQKDIAKIKKISRQHVGRILSGERRGRNR
jgi:transcriptional regulator with XRE-family HTH domain